MKIIYSECKQCKKEMRCIGLTLNLERSVQLLLTLKDYKKLLLNVRSHCVTQCFACCVSLPCSALPCVRLLNVRLAKQFAGEARELRWERAFVNSNPYCRNCVKLQDKTPGLVLQTEKCTSIHYYREFKYCSVFIYLFLFVLLPI